MRYLATATMAASVLAIGLSMEPANSLPLGGKASAPDTAIQKVQQRERMGGGQGAMLRLHERGRYGYGPGRLHRGGGFYFSGPSYGDVPSCSSLRRRAHRTGSPYWWHRYRACRGGLGG